MVGKISDDGDKVVTGSEKIAAAFAGANYGISLTSVAGWLASLSQTLSNKIIVSPTLTGTPTAPTASSHNNSDQVATTAYVDAAIPSGSGTGDVVGPNTTVGNLPLYADTSGKLLKDGGAVSAFMLGMLDDGNAVTARNTLGIYVDAQIPGGTDLDTVVLPGTYFCTDGTCTHGPTVGGQWYLQVITYGGGPAYLTQLATELATGVLWSRVKQGTWGPWLRATAQTWSSGIMFKSGSNIVLAPKFGNLLTIGGVNAVIPDAATPVTLAPTGLTVGALYYIYAVQTAGIVTSLEASTTVPVMSVAAGNQGLMVKGGGTPDPTRRLVGMARPIAGPAFSDLPVQRFVRTWLNRYRVQIRGADFGGQTVTAAAAPIGAPIEVPTSRVEFLSWLDETIDISMVGAAYNSIGNENYVAIGIGESGAPVVVGGFTGGTSASANAILTQTPRAIDVRAEGYHFAAAMAMASAGTAVFYAPVHPQLYGTIG
jgi:hypothetical protein